MILTLSSQLYQTPQRTFCSEMKPNRRQCLTGSRWSSKGYNKALYSSRAVSTASLSSGGIEVGDEPAQLCRLADSTEAHLRRVQEEKEQATEALKQAKEEALEKCRVAQQEKDDLQAKFAEDKAQIQKEKEQLLAEQIGVKEAVTRALRSVWASHR
jgi:hypothetical protein